MTKNQINYLLALATLGIVGLFFNTFYIGAKLDKKTTPYIPLNAQRSAGFMSQYPKFPPLPSVPRNFQGFGPVPSSPIKNVPPLPSAIQKSAETKKAFNAPAPAAPPQKETKT